MPEQTIKGNLGTVNPPFFFASVDLASNPTKNPNNPREAAKSNNITVTVEGLKGLPGVGALRHAFLQVRQHPEEERVNPDHFTLQVIEVGDDFVKFRVRRVDANEGWGQKLRVQMLLIAHRG